MWFLMYIVIHKPTQKITASNIKLHETFLILLISSTVKQFTKCSTKLANSRQFAKHLQDIAEIRDLITRNAASLYAPVCSNGTPRFLSQVEMQTGSAPMGIIRDLTVRPRRVAVINANCELSLLRTIAIHPLARR